MRTPSKQQAIGAPALFGPIEREPRSFGRERLAALPLLVESRGYSGRTTDIFLK